MQRNSNARVMISRWYELISRDDAELYKKGEIKVMKVEDTLYTS